MDNIADKLRTLQALPHMDKPYVRERLQAAINAIESGTQDILGASQLRELALGMLELSDTEKRQLTEAAELMCKPQSR